MNPRFHYYRLAGMVVLSFVSMYILMYAMVDMFGNVYMSLNQAYMAALMTAPMVIIELALMGMMYQNKKWNGAIIAASVVIGLVCFFFIRQQTAIDDKEFIRSMIPHHAGAILMCEKAPLQDAELQQLCQQIIASQQKEIDWMKVKLRALGQ